jgi:transcriptional regulator with XRE-family HTH domain
MNTPCLPCEAVMVRRFFNWYKKQIYTGINNTMTDVNPRALLGTFIRAHRERLPLSSKSQTRRRTPGWRREELAEAAGVGLTWITWLEQGREVSASPAALARLAEALRLNPAERASLFDLAGRRDPVEPSEPSSDMPAQVLALPMLMTVPAYLLDHLWTARAWNPAATHLFVGWLEEGAEKNLLRYVFLSDAAKHLIADWPERAQRLAAEFRADFSRRPRDAAMQALVDELSAQSPLFTKLWREQTVLHREGGERSFCNPQGGQDRYQQTTLLVASQVECKLVCLAPLG